MKISGIYKIQSLIKPERIYVGSANNMEHRWNNHLIMLRKGNHHSIKMQRHCNKYGIDDLVFIIIEPCFPQFLIIREQYYINLYNPWFNVCKIAGSKMGIKLSEQNCKNISMGHKGHLTSIETRLKISKANKGRISANKGKKMSEEQKIKIGNANRGKQPNLGTKYSDEVKLKMSLCKKGKKFTEQHKMKLSEAQRMRWEIKKIS